MAVCIVYKGDFRQEQTAIAEYMDKSVSFYDSELKEEGIYNILKTEIAFSGKKVSIKAK